MSPWPTLGWPALSRDSREHRGDFKPKGGRVAALGPAGASSRTLTFEWMDTGLNHGQGAAVQRTHGASTMLVMFGVGYMGRNLLLYS